MWFALGSVFGIALGFLLKVGVDKYRRWYEREMTRGWFDF